MLNLFMGIVTEKNIHILWHIYENYRRDMYKTAKMIIHDNHLAEDIVQASFERIINKIHLIEKIPPNDLRGYVVLLVKNLAINTCKKEHKYKLESDDNLALLSEVGSICIEDIVIQYANVEQIIKELAKMDLKYVHPLLLRYYYGFTDSETAKLLCINSVNTVRSLCYRGKKIIIEAIKNSGDSND